MNPEEISDQQKYEKLIADFTAAESANSTAYDKAILTLSGAALALSLTFAKDLAPLDRATCLPLLFGSWACFVTALAVTIASFMYAINLHVQMKFEARKVYITNEISADQMQSKLDHEYRIQHRLNLIPGGLFVLGILLLASYVSVNAWREAHKPMTEESKIPSSANFLKKSVQSTGIVPGSTSTTAKLPDKTVSPAPSTPPSSEPGRTPSSDRK